MSRHFALLALLLVVATPYAASPTVDLDGFVDASSKPAADTIVWIEAPDVRPAIPRQAPVLEQRNIQFSPRVLVVQVGSKVKFPNDDRVFHNVFSFHDGAKFDLGLYPVGTVKDVPFDHPGLSRVFCNIHPQMAAYVMAVDTPYFAVSDAQGHFTIPDLPRGTFTYHAWRSGADTTTDTVSVDATTPLRVHWQ